MTFFALRSQRTQYIIYDFQITLHQTSLICGVIDDRSRSFKAIDERVFTNFRDKNAVFTNFQAKNTVFTNFRAKNAVLTNLGAKNLIITYLLANMLHFENA